MRPAADLKMLMECTIQSQPGDFHTLAIRLAEE